MSALELSNSSTVDLEICIIAEAQVKDLKIGFMTVIEILKEEMNKSLREIHENIINNGRK